MVRAHELGCPYEHIDIADLVRLTRVSVNLIPRSSIAIGLAKKLTGDSATDIVNRSVQVYAYLEQVIANGGAIYIRESADSELEQLKFL
jgi:hypothetical protein